jgi:hypothetical protein
MNGNGPVAFHDLPASAFPLVMELLDADSREVRWTTTITGRPGGIRIPGNAETNGGKPVIARITFADGETVEAMPGG